MTLSIRKVTVYLSSCQIMKKVHIFLHEIIEFATFSAGRHRGNSYNGKMIGRFI